MNLITRERAIDVIIGLINSGVLAEELVDELIDIEMCIEFEMCGVHVWGADNDEFEEIAKAHNPLKMTKEEIHNLDELIDKFKFVPAPCEKQAIEEFLASEDED